jgi:hypothetical protein
MNWEYDTHPQRKVLRDRCVRLGAALLELPKEFDSPRCKTTCLAHKYIFRQFTPRHFPFYAGNYRGSNFDVLKIYPVGIKSDPKVGLPPALVPREMALFDKQFLAAAVYFDKMFNRADANHAVLLVKLVEILGTLLVRFLTTHPYANGNGHIGRVLFLRMMGVVNIIPAKWELDDRPPYDSAIYAHRRGDPKPLSAVLLKCIIG